MIDLIVLCSTHRLNYNNCVIKLQKRYPGKLHYILSKDKNIRYVSYWLDDDMVTYLLDKK